MANYRDLIPFAQSAADTLKEADDATDHTLAVVNGASENLKAATDAMALARVAVDDVLYLFDETTVNRAVDIDEAGDFAELAAITARTIKDIEDVLIDYIDVMRSDATFKAVEAAEALGSSLSALAADLHSQYSELSDLPAYKDACR